MFCTYCGNEVDEKADYCLKCGCKIKKISDKEELGGLDVAILIMLIIGLSMLVTLVFTYFAIFLMLLVLMIPVIDYDPNIALNIFVIILGIFSIVAIIWQSILFHKIIKRKKIKLWFKILTLLFNLAAGIMLFFRNNEDYNA